jgi:hypothetical protein
MTRWTFTATVSATRVATLGFMAPIGRQLSPVIPPPPYQTLALSVMACLRSSRQFWVVAAARLWVKIWR